MSIMRPRPLAMLLAGLGLILSFSSTPAAVPAGTVAALAGSSTARAHVLKQGDAIQVGDTIDVSTGSNLRLQMADGAVISVAPGSSFTVTSYSVGANGRHAKLTLTRGLLRVLVPPGAGPLTFEVSTEVGTASVRSGSADWFIRAEAGSAQVGVLNGTVDFSGAAAAQSVSIPAHWGTRLEAGRAPMLPRVWAQMEFNTVIRLTECCQSKEETRY
jgi:hypothetical protein